MCMSRPLLHAVVGRYAESAWGVEIDRVKADKGNAFMRYAAADMKRRNADWADFKVPSIQCAPIEEVNALISSSKLSIIATCWEQQIRFGNGSITVVASR